jgi:hypothetical protein
MAFVRIEDAFATHPKIIGLSDAAFRLHVEGMCYARTHQTDGLIPEAWVGERKPLLEELVNAGVWEWNGRGPFIHDYSLYNPSAATETARSNAARNAARMRWRMDSASKAHMRDVEMLATEALLAEDAADSHDRDIEVGLEVGLALRSKGKEARRSFDAFWLIYPRRVGKPKALAAFLKALTRASADVILAGAQRLRDDPNREPQFTPHPTTWLNRDGWEDDPLPPRGQKNARNVDNLHALAKRMKT